MKRIKFWNYKKNKIKIECHIKKDLYKDLDMNQKNSM